MNGRQKVYSISIDGKQDFSGIHFPKPLEIGKQTYDVLLDFYIQKMYEGLFVLEMANENNIKTHIFTSVEPKISNHTYKHNAQIVLACDSNKLSLAEYEQNYITNKSSQSWKKPTRRSVDGIYFIIEDVKYDKQIICLEHDTYDFLINYFKDLADKGILDVQNFDDENPTCLYKELCFCDHDQNNKNLYSIAVYLSNNTAKKGYVINKSEYLT